MESLILIAGGISTMLGYGIYIYFQSEDEAVDRQKRFEQREKVYLKPIASLILPEPMRETSPDDTMDFYTRQQIARGFAQFIIKSDDEIERPDTNTRIDRW